MTKKKVKTLLGNDITVNQVSNYAGVRQQKANRAAALYATLSTAAIIGYIKLRK